MTIEKKKDFLINCAYWGFIGGVIYLALAYLLPVFVPVILGALLAWFVVWFTGKLHCKNRVVRILLSILIYGLVGLLIGLLAVRIVSWFSDLIKWLPKVYEMKLEPFAMVCYEWATDTVARLNPTLLSAVEKALAAALSALEGLLRKVSELALGIVSSVATGVPSLILSLLAMIFTTVFLVADYERITGFASHHVPGWAQKILKNIRIYLTDTLFVVLRSYAAIMMLTFTELSILFAIFGIERPVLKAAIIAVLDILPILGTGAVLVPWAIISLMLGYASLGIELLVIYAIVTVIRNYLEPKIVGGQLGLHPIITLVSMFVGLRLFGFWGLFGTPVAISFLWKQRQEKKKAQEQPQEEPQEDHQEQPQEEPQEQTEAEVNPE